MVSLADLRADAFKRLEPPPAINLADWIEESVYLPSDVSATPGPMALFSYQRGIADALCDPTLQRVSFVKPVRIGASALIVAAVGSFVANDPCPILVLQPTLDDSRDFMVSTIEPTFAASPALRGLLRQEKSKRDTILNRRFPGGSLKCVAAASPRNLRRHTIRVLLMDEIDGYEVSTEGDPIKLAEKRTLSYPNRIIFSASTPTDAATSRICKAYEASDRRVFELPCPDCAEFFEPMWKDIVWDKAESGEHLPDTAHLVCPHCGSCIDEKHKPAMVDSGRWRATAPHVRGHAGFRCSALISTLTNAAWGVLVAEFLEAKRDPDLLKVFTNTILGEAWQDRAGEGMDSDGLAARAESFGLESMPRDLLVLTAGVDVQEDRLEIVTLGHSATQQFALAYETIWGPPTADETWRELDDLLKRRFAHPLGGTLGYDAAAVDSGSGSHTDIVYRYTRPRAARRVVSIKGMDGVRPLIEKAKMTGLFIVGVSGAKSRLYGLLKQPGHIRFSADLPARFYEELASERRVMHYVARQPKFRWERIPGMRAEALDGFVYAMAVRQLVGVDLTRRENELRQISKAQAGPTVFRSKWMEGNRDG